MYIGFLHDNRIYAVEYTLSIVSGAQLEGAPGAPAFHTLAKDMSLHRGTTHFTLGLIHALSHPSHHKDTYAPPLKIT